MPYATFERTDAAKRSISASPGNHADKKRWSWVNAPSEVVRHFFVFARTRSEARSSIKKLDVIGHKLPMGAKIEIIG